jgi:hypothetical protein
MPTVIGGFFFLASVYCFFEKDDKLFALLVFSTLFQSSSVITFEASGMEPYYLVGSLFVLQTIYRKVLGINPAQSFNGKNWMILFAVFAILSAFTLPFVFAGTPIYAQRVGLDDGFFVRPALQFGETNVRRSLSLLLGVLVVSGAAQSFRGGIYTKKAYMFAFYFLVAMVVTQFLCSTLGIEFPYALLQNHPGKTMQIVDTGDAASRYAGTFTESSSAGHVLVCFTMGFLAAQVKFGRSLIHGLIGLGTIFLVRSTGAMAGIGITLIILLLRHPLFRFPFHVNLIRLKRIALLAIIVIVILGAVIFSPLRESLIDLTLNKHEGGSFVNRVASDVYALNLFVTTRGIGVGMGSNRPSSLITSLLSTVGIIGLVLFLLTYFKLLSNAALNHPELQWAGLAYFLCLATSGPDYDAPWIWVFLAFAVRMGLLHRKDRLADAPVRLRLENGTTAAYQT